MKKLNFVNLFLLALLCIANWHYLVEFVEQTSISFSQNTQQIEIVEEKTNQIKKEMTKEKQKISSTLDQEQEKIQKTVTDSAKNQQAKPLKSVTKRLYQEEVFAKTGIKHYQYPEANPKDLVSVGAEQLHRDAAKAFLAMQENAAKKGHRLTIASGFRSIAIQAGIVARKKAEGKSFQEIFSASSYPGYSEHHTGYAMDFDPISLSFEDSDTYDWLLQNAKEYGFELSFPKNNHQKIMFEPWHWRFAGVKMAKDLFTYAEQEELLTNPTKE